jgi:F-type H+-transporting ATPase subunit epsilon
MLSDLMQLKVLLPSQIFADKSDVLRVVAETREGFFGLLPNRQDCVAALVPGILTYETRADGEMFVAVDEGILIKTGRTVQVSIRRAISGRDLGQLKHLVEQDFLTLDVETKAARSVMAKLETGLLRRLASFDHE